MESKIPLPTDNIYKFYALFGLLLIITSILSSVYISKTTNDLIFAAAEEIEALDTIKTPSSLEKFKKGLLAKKVSLAVADKNAFIIGLGAIAGLGGLLAFYGFTKWHRELQPIQDRLLALQLQKAEREERLATITSDGA
jgi:hypothetical protein